MTTGDLEDLLLKTLLRRAGGNKRRWRIVLGPLRLYDPATHPHCNWSFAPCGTAAENAVVEGLLDEVRGLHPIVLG